ncbi:unnamed protein product [Cuscuta epithymum]|uniref:START domain-containing protein n=1 Tax=Cuscuta epithymum TaxID=186058 RepID=A0AAV0C5B9_9ASTE|nr:unnamed protein product [Cuscuta epithymum]
MRQEHDIFNAATPPVFPASTGLVLASPLTLLYMFMDPEQWSSVFSNIVSTATTLEVLFPWEKEKPNNGALQVMTAEFYLPSPLFRGGEVKFARMCRETGYKTWVVVDVSLETVFPGAGAAISSHPTRRRPSGCLIQELRIHPGVSMVTWVDNSAVHDHGTFVQNMFGSLLTSNFPFSANRWISALERYYDKIVALEGQGDNNNYNGYHFQALVFSTFA